MRKRTTAPLAVFLALAGSGYFIQACTTGPVYLDPGRAGEITAPPRVQIGLGRFLRIPTAEVPSAPVTIHGAYAVTGPDGVLATGESFRGGITWENGIRIQDRTYTEPLLKITVSRDGDLEVGGRRYHGDLIILVDPDRQTLAPRITLVNEVELESYLKGVVGKEMSLSMGVEALKAQVIAARTYAMYETRQKTLRTIKGEKFDLYDDERSQVYGGMERETDHAQRLVDETRGMFVTWSGRLLKTYYSSTCGGHTQPVRQGLGEGENIPPLGGVSCGYCEGAKYFRWSETFTKAEIAAKLFPETPLLAIRGLRAAKTAETGHVLEVAIRLEGSSREYLAPANEGFRRKVDPRRIRSTLWEKLEDLGDRVVITGRGWGHGVGLCQVGAYRMADLGKSAVEILEHYYPQSVVRKIY